MTPDRSRRCTPLRFAAGDNAEGPNQVAIVRLLIAGGADPEDDALSRAATQGNLPVMEELLTHGVDPATHYGGGTIMGPCESLNPDGLRFLLEHGADPNYRDRDGSALDMVLDTYQHEHREECLELLVQAGANYTDGAEMDILRGRIDLLQGEAGRRSGARRRALRLPPGGGQGIRRLFRRGAPAAADPPAYLRRVRGPRGGPGPDRRRSGRQPQGAARQGGLRQRDPGLSRRHLEPQPQLSGAAAASRKRGRPRRHRQYPRTRSGKRFHPAAGRDPARVRRRVPERVPARSGKRAGKGAGQQAPSQVLDLLT